MLAKETNCPTGKNSPNLAKIRPICKNSPNLAKIRPIWQKFAQYAKIRPVYKNSPNLAKIRPIWLKFAQSGKNSPNLAEIRPIWSPWLRSRIGAIKQSPSTATAFHITGHCAMLAIELSLKIVKILKSQINTSLSGRPDWANFRQMGGCLLCQNYENYRSSSRISSIFP
jgi:hypothetical protein